MKELDITLYGRIPSKKNSVNMFVKNGRLFKLPSNAYKVWHKDASWQIKSLGIEKARVSDDARHVSIVLFAPDRRKADLTNKAESIMDLLVDSGILADDNWFCVPQVLLTFGGVEKDNPRAEIKITKA